MKKSDVLKKGFTDLHDIDVKVRVRAVKALGKYKDPNVVSVLIKALQDDKDSLVRIQVVKSLGRIEDEKSISALIRVLEDEDDGVRSSAVNFFYDGINRIAISASNPALIPALIRLLENDELEHIRKYAASILGDIKAQSAVLPLIRYLEDEDDHLVKGNAIRALGKIRNVRSVPTLVNFLLNDPLCRHDAGKALVEINDIFTIPLLIKAMENEDAEVRMVATKTLGEMIDGETHIINFLESYRDLFRYKPLNAMFEEIEYPYNFSILSAFVRQKYAETSSEFKDISVTTALIEALKNNKDPYVRIEATKALGKIREKRAVPTLINALEYDKSESFSRYAAESLRSSAAEALGKIRDTRAVPSLIYSLENDETESVRNSAAEALRMFKNNETAINTLAKKGI